MMRAGLSYKIIWLTLFAALVLAGCSSSPSVEYYSLNSISNTRANTNTLAANQPLSIGIGPVAIPEILDRPQIVTRTGPNTLQIDEFHRWAGRLDENFARVLADKISLLLATDQVAIYPWDVGFKPRYQVSLDIQYFEGRWGEDVLLEVLWTVIEPQTRKTLRVKKSVIRESFTAKDYETLIATQSRAVATLGDKIAFEINKLQSDP